jgi:hypothetical protein
VPPERDLRRLLASIHPELQAGTFVFCALGGDPPSDVTPLMVFRELEATTAVVPLELANAAGLAGEFPCQWIVLGARSDLRAVGFLAEITARLAADGISANVVSAFHHDHLFVPAGRGERAVELLLELQRR